MTALEACVWPREIRAVPLANGCEGMSRFEFDETVVAFGARFRWDELTHGGGMRVDTPTSSFGPCMKGEGPDGWDAGCGVASDSLTCPGLSQTTWHHPNEKLERPWTKLPQRGVDG